MAEEGFDNTKNTSDPDEDYGLPKIEIKPIQKAELKQTKKPVIAGVGTEPGSAKPVVPPNREETKQKAVDAVAQETGKNYSLLVMILVLAGILVGGWFYYDRSSNGEQQAETKEPDLAEQVAEPLPPVQEIIEVPAEEVETYTLTEIKSRGDNIRYFLVVASFIDEDLAKDHAEKLHSNKMNTFLVYPYGEIAYYRLAIGQFESFALAAQEIDKVKANFKENLWVLKY